METISQTNEALVTINQLDLTNQEIEVLKNLLEKIFAERDVKNFLFLQINRGLSKAKKIAAKPHNLYPLMIKISSKREILEEYEGYRNLRFKVNSSNLLFCEGIAYNGETGGIAYQYVTRGRVRDTYDRLDTIPRDGSKEDTERVIRIINNVFESALKKCHFGHGLPKDVRPVTFSKENTSIFTDNLFSEEQQSQIINVYNEIIGKACGILAPFGTVHGDLHPKNVIVGINDIPILIDYNYVKSGECIYTDYAKLEVHMLTMFPRKVTASFFNRKLFERQFSFEPLILPRSGRDFLSAVIFEIRKNLWKNSMSNDIGRNYLEIDKVYRAYLAYHFLKIVKKCGVSEWSRRMAYMAILSLGGHIFK